MAKLVIGTDKTVGTPAVVIEKKEKYSFLSRVKDDSDNDIGCVVCYHIDANNQKYAVVCLNAEYRTRNSTYCINTSDIITNLPVYSGFLSATSASETATFNCDKILDFCVSVGTSSSAVSHCRSKSFVIGGVTYYGQLPNIAELQCIFINKTTINNSDQTSGPAIPDDYCCWSSNQQSERSAWIIWGNSPTYTNRNGGFCASIPVLEIPID